MGNRQLATESYQRALAVDSGNTVARQGEARRSPPTTTLVRIPKRRAR
jgi:hypothetical protein